MTGTALSGLSAEGFDGFILKLDSKLRQTGPVFWVTFCGIFLMLAIALGTSLLIANISGREIERTQRELEGTVRLLSRHFDNYLEDFEAVPKSVVDVIATKARTPDEFFSLVKTEDFHQLLREKLSATRDFAGVNIFDSEGYLVNSSERWPARQLDIADRDFFQAFRSGEAHPPLILQLVESRLSEGSALVFARKIQASDGTFLGTVTRSISPTSLQSFFSTLLPEGSLAMVHRDGTLLARYPVAQGALGTRLNTPLLDRASSDGYASLQLPSPLDGQELLASARSLAHYPIYVVATKPASVIFANRARETRTFIGAAVLAACVVALMLVTIVRHLREQHRRLDIAVSNMTQGLLLYDSSERLIFCNNRYLEIFSLSADVVKPGCKFRDIAQHRKNLGTLAGDVDEYCDQIRRGVGSQQILLDKTPDGRWLQVSTQPVSGGGWASTVEDVTERRRSEEKTARLAMYDTLTDLPNRATFHDELEYQIQRCTPESGLAVLFIDTDEFKSINDTMGHHVGDELLRSIGRSLHSCKRADEFVARLGGDEFAMISPNIASEADALLVIDRVHQAIRKPHICEMHQISVDASVGVALALQHGTNCDELLQSADLAMYEAKSSGKRTFRFFDPSLGEKAKDRRLLEMDLREALSNETLEVFYQPILDLKSGIIVGCEALARWNHATRGFVSPGDFIPIAEQSGLIETLGQYVLQKACLEASTWPSNIKVAVNVSPAQIRSSSFSLKVLSALNSTGLHPNRLELEITEAVLIQDDELALSLLQNLRSLGVRIALDDFGTGYSSLSYLQRFPFDKIKIDRSFISALSENGGTSIIRAVVDIASERNMVTTAEGVETEEQRSALRDLNCVEMQGFLFSPARPGREIKKMLTGLTRTSHRSPFHQVA